MNVERAFLQLAEKIKETQTPVCMETDPDAWFPEQGGGLMPDTRKAKKLCQQCPAQKECLNYALVANEQYGIWGGLAPRERAQLRRK